MSRVIAIACGFLCILHSSDGAVPGDEHWDNQFGPVGANLQLQTITVCGNKVYVGGFLTAAGNTKANFVAGFDGTNWFALNNGLSPSTAVVVGLGSDGTNVYVGGLFTNADNSGAVNNAVWNGSSFSPLPDGGLAGIGYVFKRQGSSLYVGGVFTTAGTATANGIARWDGASWQPLGTGVSGCTGQFCSSGIIALAFQGSDVYAGGNFTFAGGVGASYVARYDGSIWHALGSTINGPVSALAFYGGYLYAGGSFTNTSAGLTNIARWDGASWSAVSGGEANRSVADFATDGTNLYVGGLFSQIGGIAAKGIAALKGNSWSTLGLGLQSFQGNIGQANKMVWQSNQLYVAGIFERAGNVGASDVARWDGTNWWDLGGQTSKGMIPNLNFVQSLLSIRNPIFFQAGLYAGGIFTEAGNVLVNGISLWDGTNWNPVGTGVSGAFGSSVAVRALATDGAYLYAAGNFTSAGGNPASGIAYWDGSNWSPLGSGVDWIVNALAVDDANYIYVGGTFTNAGGIYSRGLAVSAYGSWYNLGNVEGTNGAVNSLVFDGSSKIYVGGSFFTAGGISATNIAYFDNSDFSWHPLGNSLNAKVNTLAYGNGILYAGGSFTKAGSLAASHIAQWDGSNWSALGSGITGSSSVIVNSIFVSGTNVYVTGNFTNAGGVIATNIAKWDGTKWSALGSGLEIPRAGFALAAIGDDLFVGGNFAFAGDKPAEFIARWNDQMNFYPPPNPQLTRTVWLTNRQMQFRLLGTSGENYIIQTSTNLSTWIPLLTNSATLYDFTDTNASKFPARFYRAVLGP